MLKTSLTYFAQWCRFANDIITYHAVYLLLRTQERLRSIVMSTSVCVCLCVSVCPRGYLWNHMSDFYQIFVHVTYDGGSFLRRR